MTKSTRLVETISSLPLFCARAAGEYVEVVVAGASGEQFAVT